MQDRPEPTEPTEDAPEPQEPVVEEPDGDQDEKPEERVPGES